MAPIETLSDARSGRRPWPPRAPRTWARAPRGS